MEVGEGQSVFLGIVQRKTPPLCGGFSVNSALHWAFNSDIGLRTLFTVNTNSPLRTCKFNCRLLNPATGMTITLDQNTFEVQWNWSKQLGDPLDN